jgi:hypothetical protein
LSTRVKMVNTRSISSARHCHKLDEQAQSSLLASTPVLR